MTTAPAAVIFDCDGVLVDSEILAVEVEIVLLAEIGLSYEPAEYRRRFHDYRRADVQVRFRVEDDDK